MFVAPEFGETPDSLVNTSPNQLSLPRAETISWLKQIHLPLVVQLHLDHAGHVSEKKNSKARFTHWMNLGTKSSVCMT